MKALQTVSLALAAFAGCSLGSYLAFRPSAAKAQVQPVRSESRIIVPNGGLTYVSSNGQALGRLQVGPNGLQLVFLRANGEPAIFPSDGGDGPLTLGPAGLRVLNESGGEAITLSASGASLLQMRSPSGGIKAAIAAEGDGGRLSLGGSSATLIDLLAKGKSGKAVITGDNAQIDAEGDGKLTITKEGKPVFVAPGS